MTGTGFGGIGAYLIMKINGQVDEKATPEDMKSKGQVFVDGLVEGSPAEKAGLQVNDLIESINGQPTHGHTINEVVQLVRGEVGTKAELGVVRNGQSMTITVVRAIIKILPVKAKKLSNQIGYLRISTFFEKDMHELVSNALENELADCDGYIVDLRNNGGGFMDEAVYSAANFLDQGTVVSMKLRSDNGFTTRAWELKEHLIYQTVSENGRPPQKEMMQLRRGNLTGSKPVVILVNNRSASAAEVFTSALKDNVGAGTTEHRVIILGTDTFGKGIVQSLIPMPFNTELHVTSARYFSPNGTWFGDGAAHKIGIHPDVVVAPVDGLQFGSANDNQLQAAADYLKKALSNPASDKNN